MGCRLEVAAEALGSKFQGKLIGSRSFFGGFSFRGAKIVTTGEGGVFVTSNHDRLSGLSKLIDSSTFLTKRICYWFENFGYRYVSTNSFTNDNYPRYWFCICPFTGFLIKTILTKISGMRLAHHKPAFNLANSFSVRFKLDLGEHLG
jgi:DegT/DnrJ/EryC1/StrS aminotransferase family